MSIQIQDVQKEVNEYVKGNQEIISTGVYSPEITLNAHCRTITAINGKYPSFHKILGHVVQGFKAEWQALGEASFKHKMLQSFRQKVNFEVVPDEVLHTWLAYLFAEGKKKEDHPISKHIIEELMAKVIDDLEDLSQTGVFNAANADGQFGQSLDGIATQVTKALADTDHPAFRIPLNAITPTNIIDEVKSFEKQLPRKTRRKVKKIFMSHSMMLEYADQYEQAYGTKVTFVNDDTIKTPLTKMLIVGLDVPDTVMFAPVEGVMARLIDVIDKPRITDVQVQDYVLKLFMDFFLGYDFLVNELVYVAVFDGSDRGLGDAALNALYYDSEGLTVTP